MPLPPGHCILLGNDGPSINSIWGRALPDAFSFRRRAVLVRWIGLWAGLLVAAAHGAQAQEAAFAGRWRITDAAIAPWAVPKRALDTGEAKRLIGQIVVFGPHSVTGPRALRCARTKYVMHDYPPDMIFEGALAEPDAAGTPRDAAALARGLGMTTPTARTLEMGGECPEISFYRLAPDTLVFGLNDRIYTLHRDPK